MKLPLTESQLTAQNGVKQALDIIKALSDCVKNGVNGKFTEDQFKADLGAANVAVIDLLSKAVNCEDETKVAAALAALQ